MPSSTQPQRRLDHWIQNRALPGGAVALEVRGFEGPLSFSRAEGAWLIEALAAAQNARGPWLATPAKSRREWAAKVLDELLEFDGWADDLACALGLEEQEVDPEIAALEQLAHSLAQGRLQGTKPRRGSNGVALLCGHWSYLGAELIGLVIECWVRGWPVVLAGSEVLPALPSALGEAAAAAGLPGGVLAVLHAPDPAALRALLTHPGPECESLVLLGRSPEAAAWSATPAAKLGQKWLGKEALIVPRRALRRVLLHEDPIRLGLEAARQVFARWPGLGGERHGSETCWLVHERSFSAFSEALLGSLERGAAEVPRARKAARARRAAPSSSLRPIEEGAEAHFRQLVRCGLEEGACLIFGPQSANEAEYGPAVFTNCEPGMRLVADTRPAPILRLLRVQSDAKGAEWATELG